MAHKDVSFKLMPEITKPMLQKYADASGDHNEIHLSDDIARKRGLPGVIAHGMLIAGMLGERGLLFFEEQSGKKGYVSRFNSRFRGMVLPGDRISIGGTVKNATETEWVIDLQAKNQRDEVTTSAVMTITLTN